MEAVYQSYTILEDLTAFVYSPNTGKQPQPNSLAIWLRLTVLETWTNRRFHRRFSPTRSKNIFSNGQP